MPGVGSTVASLVMWNKSEVAKLPAASVSWAWDDVVDRGPQGGGDVDASLVTRLRDHDHVVQTSDGEWTVSRTLDEYVAEKYGIELEPASKLGPEQAELPIDSAPSPGRSSLVADGGDASPAGRTIEPHSLQVGLDGGRVDKEGVRTRRWRAMEQHVDRDGLRKHEAARADAAQLTLGEAVDRWDVTVAASALRLQRRSGEAYPTVA